MNESPLPPSQVMSVAMFSNISRKWRHFAYEDQGSAGKLNVTRRLKSYKGRIHDWNKMLVLYKPEDYMFEQERSASLG